MKELKAGIIGNDEVIVTEANTAAAMGSGTLPVFATPALVALMEKTAQESVQDALEEGCGSVGTMICAKHVSATPLGMKVTCQSELVAVEGRKLVFKITASDACGVVGEADHERFIIQNEKFLKKANSKNEQ